MGSLFVRKANKMEGEYIYRAYGLIFSSELQIPELESAEGSPDVEIRLGAVPAALSVPREQGQWFQATADEFLFRLDAVAGFYVADGRQITIELFTDPGDPEVRLFLLGSVFCALLHQRGYLALHGSAVEMRGKGLLFTGDRGVGKSTLAAAFHDKGYRILADDVCAVRLGQDGTPYIVPGFPGLKLWRDSVERMGKSLDSLTPVKRDIGKYRVSAAARYSDEPAVLAGIYILDIHDKHTIEITKLESIAKLEALVRNTYRYQYLNGQEMKALHFQQCAAVADKVDIFKLLRPVEGFLLSELVAAIEGNVEAHR